MKELSGLGLQFNGERVLILDQQALPEEEIWLDATHPERMIDAIKNLKVRGAPLIGVAAALSLACFAQQAPDDLQVSQAAEQLRQARPTAVNLMWAIDRMLQSMANGGRTLLIAEAVAIFEEDVLLCERMANWGAALIEDGDGILTHCNTGGLATVGIGTALGVIRKAWEQGKKITVYVDETRPLLQGARLTAWELQTLGIPYVLQTDSMAAIQMQQGRIQKVFVGADRIAANGDFANKVGTYSLAIAAAYHRIPFYTVAPYSTVDLQCADGTQIEIEQRGAEEVRGAAGWFGAVRWSPAEANVFNPSFDVTPCGLVKGLVMDRGIIEQSRLQSGALREILQEK